MSGVWQLDDTVIAAGLNAAFRFYPNGKFTYSPSDYDYLNPVVAVRGEYLVTDSALLLKITESETLTNYTITLCEPAWETGTFAVYSKNTNIIQQPDSLQRFERLSLKACNAAKSCAKIGSNRFYKISNDPNKY